MSYVPVTELDPAYLDGPNLEENLAQLQNQGMQNKLGNATYIPESISIPSGTLEAGSDEDSDY